MILKLNIIVLLIECIYIILLKTRILAWEYGWEQRRNIMLLIFIMFSHIIFLLLIDKVPFKKQRRSLHIGQLLVFVCVLIWVSINLEIHYRLS